MKQVNAAAFLLLKLLTFSVAAMTCYRMVLTDAGFSGLGK